MFLYEIYYINKYKPKLNRDDKSKDKLTISLKELEFCRYDTKLIDKWKKHLENSQKNENNCDDLDLLCALLGESKNV